MKQQIRRIPAEGRKRVSARQRFLEFLRRWGVVGCGVILLAVIDGRDHGWTRSLISTGALVAILVHALSKAFVLFLALLAVADERRRRADPEPERHWWHRDLSDEKIVAELLSNGS